MVDPSAPLDPKTRASCSFAFCFILENKRRLPMRAANLGDSGNI